MGHKSSGKHNRRKGGKSGKGDKTSKNAKYSTKKQQKGQTEIKIMRIGIVVAIVIAVMFFYSMSKGADFVARNPQILEAAAA